MKIKIIGANFRCQILHLSVRMKEEEGKKANIDQLLPSSSSHYGTCQGELGRNFSHMERIRLEEVLVAAVSFFLV